MIFYKMYIDDGQDQWFEIGEERVRICLAMYLAMAYGNVDLAMEELEDGHTVRTQFALYKAEREGVEENREEKEGEENEPTGS